MNASQGPAATARDPDQAEHERAMGEISDVLLNLEHSLDRAKRARKLIAKSGTEINSELALTSAIKDLERLRKRLMQDTYFAGDNVRLI